MMNIKHLPSAIGIIIALATISSCGPSKPKTDKNSDDKKIAAAIPCSDTTNSLVTTAISTATQDGLPVIYLSKTGCGLANGSSWANAASISFLKKADLLTKNIRLNKVFIMQGVYKPTTGTNATDATTSFDFPLSAVALNSSYGVEYIGGFLGDSSLASSSDPSKYPTIFCGRSTATNSDCSDGTNSNQIINTTAAIGLTNLTLTGGYSNTRGAAVNAGSISVKNVNFTNNKAKTEGGAIYTSAASTNSIVNYSNFENNESSTDGGAINGSDLKILNSSFSGNKASSTGGAIRSRDNIVIINSNFSANNATSNGHAVYVPTLGLIANSSFANHTNSAIPTIYGANSNSVLLLNSIVYDKSNNRFDTITGILAKTQRVFSDLLLGGNSSTDGTDKIINSDPKWLPRQNTATSTNSAWYFPLGAGSPAIAAGVKIWADSSDATAVSNVYYNNGGSYKKFSYTTLIIGSWGASANSTSTEATSNTKDISNFNIIGNARDASPNIGPS